LSCTTTKPLVDSQNIRGWLLDLYPSKPGEMTLWIISENGERVKIVDGFQPRIYVSGEEKNTLKLVEKLIGDPLMASWRFVHKYANISDFEKSKVLEIDVTDYGEAHHLAGKILRLGGYEKFQLGNVDLQESQAYLYDRDIFPLAFMQIMKEGKSWGYGLLDSVESVDYAIPPLRTLRLEVEIAKSGKFPSFEDPIDRIFLKSEEQEIEIDSGDEQAKLQALVENVKALDPDIIFTKGGDSTVLPYLSRRAAIRDVLRDFILGREGRPIDFQQKKGASFFSYGRVYYKAASRRLYGRIHIDTGNTMIFHDTGLDGLIEVARTCRVPLHRAARSSIGTIMTSLQLYRAYRDDVVIPWKKGEAESFKSASELLLADRGGFIFEPKVGLHDWVGEIDFSSMYPNLMVTKNISGETIRCSCCLDSKLRVPELGYNICERRVGIVPRTIAMILKKRSNYKRLKSEADTPELREVYDLRQSALKWILVTSFGYLGYKNARFGKIDAHIAVCAFARDTLLRTTHLAEERGFNVLHGIVDSLWLRKKGAIDQEFIELCRDISKEVGIHMSFEGRYKWIVFLPSRTHEGVPVLNRYYGIFESGKTKVRGIEARRRDTPNMIREAQLEMINVLGEAFDSESFIEKIPEVLEVLRSYSNKLLRGEIDVEDLIVTKHLSMKPEEYVHNVFQAIASMQLAREGMEIAAGQNVRYLITDSENLQIDRRVLASELIDEGTRYDAKKYLEMLVSATTNILSPFGYSDDRIYDFIMGTAKQIPLNYPKNTR
jgi:DNA polymerase elongation subunit (family B)